MAINNIANGEAGSSIRAKLNLVITEVNKLISGVYATVQQLANAGAETVNFTPNLLFNKNYISEHQVAAPIAFTFDPGSAPNENEAAVGKKWEIFLTANGINKPTFGAEFTPLWDNWKNDANTINRVWMEYVGNGKVAYHITYID